MKQVLKWYTYPTVTPHGLYSLVISSIFSPVNGFQINVKTGDSKQISLPMTKQGFQ